MSHRIKKVEYVIGYTLRLYFDDKSVKIVDLENALKNAKNMLLPLKDIDYFKQVKCDGITICWPNEVDFCPDVLYDMGKDVPSSAKTRRSVASGSRKKSNRHKKSKQKVSERR